MSRDLTTDHMPRPLAPGHSLSALVGGAARLLGAMALGALLFALAYQAPVVHTVDIGGYDAAYVQGFYDPERSDAPGDRPYLAGSDGSARWTPDTAYLLFPQAGLPAQVTLRLRGWRAQGAAPDVRVLLNGATELAHFRASGGWEEHRFVIGAGLLKPNDIVIEIRSETATLQPDDPRRVGVLLDRATYQVGPVPITPYPAPLLYGALAAGMLYILLVSDHAAQRQGDQRTSSAFPRLPIALSPGLLAWFGAILALSAAFLLLDRAQPLYPYPVRGLLPTLDCALAALLALRYSPALTWRVPALLDAVALVGLGLWTAAVLLVARGHLTLAVPGVEKDFRVFASRSTDLGGVFQADGFYNLGYPLLLWLARPLAQDNPFLAARLVAALSAALLLGATWWPARRWLGRGAALLALLVLALSPLVVEYALYLGTDMPFAALCMLSLALLLAPITALRVPRISPLLAGLVAGLAFLMRHPGVLLLPIGWLALAVGQPPQEATRATALAHVAGLPRGIWRALGRARTPLLMFTLAFLIAILPQLVVNIAQTGRPLYSQQAKNIWLAVFGDGDWGRWGEAANEITLGQVVLQDPGRFAANWWANVRGYVGSGGEDTSEFGHAIQLRLLGFPANWLALAGLLLWAGLGLRRIRRTDRAAGRSIDEERFAWSPGLLVLLAWVGLYVLTISVGFALPRFFLPLAPIYAIAAAWLITRNPPPPAGAPDRALDRTTEPNPPAPTHATNASHARIHLAVGLVLLALLWGGFATGMAYVLGSQPADEVAAVRMVQTTLVPGDRLIVRVPARVALGKYSAIAQLALPAPATDEPAALHATGAGYLLWSADVGPAPAVGPSLGTAGPYTLYRIGP
jgi:hypothetical protein